MRVEEKLITAIRSSAVFNSEVEVAPVCILWPDRDHQWEPIIQRLQTMMPELFVLGDYDPDKKTGPAIWLRCVIAEKITIALPSDQVPIIYLPGISRQDLRVVKGYPDKLKPLAELQYRGVIWSQLNAKDWTILAFLKSDQGGLGLDVAKNNDAKNAMQIALYRLLDEDIALIQGKRLDKDYFNTLLTGGDPVRDLLQWLDQGDGFRKARGDNEWKAFVEVCKSQLAFNPEADGILAGAEKLAHREGPWKPVWERLCEAPTRYQTIPAQIRKCKMPMLNLFSNAQTHGGWPQWNQEQEESLRKNFGNLCNEPPHIAREKIIAVDKQHSARRDLVWAELGESPLALALKHLTVLAATTKNSLAAGSAMDMAKGYCNSGWQADNAVIQALACVDKHEDYEAVTTAIHSIYLPWLEESARHLQKEVDGSTYPGGSIKNYQHTPSKDGECVLFIDGLRFDLAKQLTEILTAKGFNVEEKQSWAALPSVTATGKAAVTPVRKKITGAETSADFEPQVLETGQSLKGGYHLKKLMEIDGWQVLNLSNSGDCKGKCWTEIGEIDHEGHQRGWKLARHIDKILQEILDRILQLSASGWKTIRIVGRSRYAEKSNHTRASTINFI